MSSKGAKVVKLDRFFDLVGSDGQKVRVVTKDKTRKLRSIVSRLSLSDQAITCIRTLVQRYPEEALLELAISKFFDSRTADNHSWESDLIDLSQCLSRVGSPAVMKMLDTKIAEYCPSFEEASSAGE